MAALLQSQRQPPRKSPRSCSKCGRTTYSGINFGEEVWGFWEQTKQNIIAFLKMLFISHFYTAQVTKKHIRISREGEKLLTLPLTCGLTGEDPDEFERLSDLHIDVTTTDTNKTIVDWEQQHTIHLTNGNSTQSTQSTQSITISITANSSIWSKNKRKFVWTLLVDHIKFQHTAQGEPGTPLSRCFFFSNDKVQPWGTAGRPGFDDNMFVEAEKVFTTRINHGNEVYFSPNMPQSVGILTESNRTAPGEFIAEQSANLFAPPPMALMFGSGHVWASVGLGDKPGNYLFNSFEFSGMMSPGVSIYLHTQ
jgi:hypothetical protein